MCFIFNSHKKLNSVIQWRSQTFKHGYFSSRTILGNDAGETCDYGRQRLKYQSWSDKSSEMYVQLSLNDEAKM